MSGGPLLVQWQAYLALVVPDDAADVQREETRRAFYAGAFAMYSLMLAAAEHDDEAVIEERLAALEAEARAIVDDLRIVNPLIPQP